MLVGLHFVVVVVVVFVVVVVVVPFFCLLKRFLSKCLSIWFPFCMFECMICLRVCVLLCFAFVHVYNIVCVRACAAIILNINQQPAEFENLSPQ